MEQDVSSKIRILLKMEQNIDFDDLFLYSLYLPVEKVKNHPFASRPRCWLIARRVQIYQCGLHYCFVRVAIKY
jgi:hypothetical protein